MIRHNTYTKYTWRFDSHFGRLMSDFIHLIKWILEQVIWNSGIELCHSLCDIYLNYLILLWMFMTQLWSADGQPWDWSNSDELWCHTCHSSLWYVKFITWWWFSTVIIRWNGYHPQAATCIYVNNSIYIYLRDYVNMYIREIRPLSDWLYSHLYFASVTVRTVQYLIRSIPYWDVYIHTWS